MDDLIASCYEAVIEPSQWNAVTDGLAHLLNIQLTHLYFLDHQTLQVTDQAFSVEDPVAVAQGFVDYAAHYLQIDYRRAYCAGLPSGQWFQCHDIFNEDEIRNTEFYNDFMRRWDCRYLTGTRLVEVDGIGCYLGLQQGFGSSPLSRQDMRTLARLQPQIYSAPHVFTWMKRHVAPTPNSACTPSTVCRLPCG